MSRFVQRGRALLFVLTLLAVGVVACERPKSEVVKPTVTPDEAISGNVTVPTIPPETPVSEEATPTTPPLPTTPPEATAMPSGQPDTQVEPEPTTVAVASPTPVPQPAEPTPEPSDVTPAETGTPSQRVHVVQRGEWIYAIARQYEVSPQAIIRANNIQSPDLIFPGQVLIIPSDGGAPPAGRMEHVVKAGETLYSIAQQYNTTVQAIKRLNGLETDVIYVGQVLVIP
ncbi:MAG: LysM peptidoglycan-binding domain-containing protein [Ardenticatenia bacterium]|nr:LysM peptidoglycan-binding domain-containing protein [Ardenticatenia bacterium]